MFLCPPIYSDGHQNSTDALALHFPFFLSPASPVPFTFPSFVLSLNSCVSVQLMESDRKKYKGRQAGAQRQRLQELETIEKKRWKCTQHLPGELVFLLISPFLSLSVSRPQHGTSDTPQRVDPSLCLFHVTAGSSACLVSKRFMIRPRCFLRFRCE